MNKGRLKAVAGEKKYKMKVNNANERKTIEENLFSCREDF